MIIEAHYLPCIEYFVAISDYDEICLEVYENYQKQSFRNRSNILTANKIDALVVPITKNKSKEIVKNIKIDYSQNWVKRHLGAIQAAYGKSPFFEHFYDYFRIELEKKTDFLVDLNFELLSICLKLMKSKKRIIFSENYQETSIDDFRGTIHPKNNISESSYYEPIEYSQNFGVDFVPNLSIIDALMCHGPSTGIIIEQSKKIHFEHI
jgi:WbqC-like protein family